MTQCVKVENFSKRKLFYKCPQAIFPTQLQTALKFLLFCRNKVLQQQCAVVLCDNYNSTVAITKTKRQHTDQ